MFNHGRSLERLSRTPSTGTLGSRRTYADNAGIVMARLAVAVATALTTWACASGGAAGGVAVPRPFPGGPAPPGRAAEAPPAAADGVVRAAPVSPDVVATALSLRGTPYRNGGSEPSGFDCSGFVQWVFARHATFLPRETQAQYQAGEPVPLDAVQPGDLVFFETVARGASHVGVVVGGGQFVHAPSSRGVVRVESYDAAYWSARFVGARRIVRLPVP